MRRLSGCLGGSERLVMVGGSQGLSMMGTAYTLQLRELDVPKTTHRP